jgi:hypothetical protein
MYAFFGVRDTWPASRNIRQAPGQAALGLVHGLDFREGIAEVEPGDLDVVVGLQIEPKLRRRAERLGEPKRGIGRDARLLAGDPLDSRPRQTTGPHKSARRQLERDEKLLPQYLARMHGLELPGHRGVPGFAWSRKLGDSDRTFKPRLGTVDTPSGAPGLGLPIAQALMSMHDGTFELKSKLREGTKVIAAFPRSRVMEALPPISEGKRKGGVRWLRAG